MDDQMKEARQIIEKERKARIERCKAKIEQVLGEEDCSLDAVMIVSRQGVIPQINIRSNPES